MNEIIKPDYKNEYFLEAEVRESYPYLSGITIRTKNTPTTIRVLHRIDSNSVWENIGELLLAIANNALARDGRNDDPVFISEMKKLHEFVSNSLRVDEDIKILDTI